MVAAVRQGQSLRAVARVFHVSPATVLLWFRHADGQRLDRVDWSDRPHTPIHTQRTADAIEDLVLQLRRQLRQDSSNSRRALNSLKRRVLREPFS